MFYSFKNFKLKLNNNEFLANEAQINVSTNLNPVYLQGNRHSSNYSVNGGIEGALRFNYYLTGSEYLKRYITGEFPISGNIGEMFFKEGYLKTYSINATPNNPVLANAEIVFFEPLTGDFVPKTPIQNEEFNVLNFADCSLTSLNNFSEETFSNVLSINYNFNADIKPVYFQETGLELNDVKPNRIFFGIKEINTDIILDNTSGYLPIQGHNAGIKVNFRHPNLPNLSENFTCSGVLYQRNVQTSIDNIIRPTISIKQNNLEDKNFHIVVHENRWIDQEDF